MPQRDIQADLRQYVVETVAITALSAPTDETSTLEIDTQGMRAILFGIEPGEALSTDVINFEVWECATSGGTFTDVAADKYLPKGGATLLVDAASSIVQTFGVHGTLRYIKVNFATTTVADDLTVNIYTTAELAKKAADVTGIDTLP